MKGKSSQFDDWRMEYGSQVLLANRIFVRQYLVLMEQRISKVFSMERIRLL